MRYDKWRRPVDLRLRVYDYNPMSVLSGLRGLHTTEDNHLRYKAPHANKPGDKPFKRKDKKL